MSETFNAFVLNKDEGGFSAGVQQLTLADLPEGDITVRVQYSSVNFKDGLACLPESPVVYTYPMVPGIDLAGTVVESSNPRFTVGQEVLAIGQALGISQFGGYAEYARLSSDWVEPLPAGLTLKDAMALDTAGFTAGLAVQRLCLGFAAGAGAGGCVCELPRLDVDAGALPGHQDLGVRVSHARVCAAIWRAVAG